MRLLVYVNLEPGEQGLLWKKALRCTSNGRCDRKTALLFVSIIFIMSH
jgi:hypothetical protein